MLARAVGEQAFGVPARQPQLEQPLGGNEGKDRDRLPTHRSCSSSPAQVNSAEAARSNKSSAACKIDGVAVAPAVRLLIPFDRGDDVPCGDGRVVEHARQPVEQRLAAERLAGNGLASAWAMTWPEQRLQSTADRVQALHHVSRPDRETIQ
ncbi:MAG: hypothetical protein WKF52_10035 [Sphingomicrobium sp.]